MQHLEGGGCVEIKYPKLRMAYRDVRERAKGPPERNIGLSPVSGSEARAVVVYAVQNWDCVSFSIAFS